MDGYATGAVGEEPDWVWPPYAPEEARYPRYRLEEWAPPSTVRRPWVRVGRFVLLYRRVG